MTKIAVHRMTAGDLLEVISTLIAEKRITADTPIAATSDPEGNGVNYLSGFDIAGLTSDGWRTDFAYDEPGDQAVVLVAGY